MGYEYIVSHIPLNATRRPGKKITPKYLTIHSTGNANSTAQNERAWLINPNNTRQASWHICIDDKEAIEAIPLDEMAYHAGTNEGNSQSISIEICESADRKKTLENAAQLAAKILKEHGWGIDRLKRHYDWSGKVCPRILSANNWAGWEEFKRMIGQNLNGGNTMFIDTKGHWAEKDIEEALKLGLIAKANKFYPNSAMTRAEVTVILMRLYRLLKGESK